MRRIEACGVSTFARKDGWKTWKNGGVVLCGLLCFAKVLVVGS